MEHSMNFLLFITYILTATLLPISFFSSEIHAKAEDTHVVLHTKMNQIPDAQNRRKLTRKKQEKLINFYFDNEPLIDIINFLAAEKEINIVLPVFNPINSTVTLHLEEKITIDEAWDILYTLLDLAGYSMIAKEQTYNIVKTSKEVSKEPLPLYIVKPEEIPNIDKRIRYLYYFSNIRVGEDNPQNEILGLLKVMLPDETALYKLEPQTNSVLITDKANNIKGAMEVVRILDQVEEQEKPEIIQLRYFSAEALANLFNEQLLKTAGDANQMRLGIKPPNNATYFKKVKIVADKRNNRLIVFGKKQAIERVREFIQKHIDVELESGNSILHTYQLQYLDAKSFAPTLQEIVKSQRIGGTEQSKTESTQGGGTERWFDGVIIVADHVETISGEEAGGGSRGTNSLIIAAKNDDYARIKKLIESLDTPQRQVIIEVLIADLTIQDIASLGANMRNPMNTGLSNGVNFQSSMLSTGSGNGTFLTDSVVNPTTIQSDLLRRAFNESQKITENCDPGSSSTSGCYSAAQFFSQGATIFSFNDPESGKTWGIAQIRKFLDNTKVLSQPHFIATDNKEAVIILEEQRLARDQGSGSTGGTTTQTRKWIPAALKVIITPRISSGDIVNLKVTIDINQFDLPAQDFTNVGAQSENTANRITRNVTTSANIRTGQILALGGLTRVDNTVEQLETPLLAKIPLVGWLFKSRTNTVNKNNLTVFIAPTIIEPRVRGGVGTYTKNHVQLIKSYSREGMLFDNLRDPITRWFFKAQKDDAETDIDNFIAQDEFIAPTIYDVRNERRIIAENEHPDQEATVSGDLTHKVEKEIIAQGDTPLPVHTLKEDPSAIVASAPKPQSSIERDASEAAPINNLRSLLADVDNPFTGSKVKA